MFISTVKLVLTLVIIGNFKLVTSVENVDTSAIVPKQITYYLLSQYCKLWNN